MQPRGPGRTGPWVPCPHCPKITVCFFFQSPNHFFFLFFFFLKKKKKRKEKEKNETKTSVDLPLSLPHPQKGKGVLRVYFLTIFFCLS